MPLILIDRIVLLLSSLMLFLLTHSCAQAHALSRSVVRTIQPKQLMRVTSSKLYAHRSDTQKRDGRSSAAVEQAKAKGNGAEKKNEKLGTNDFLFFTLPPSSSPTLAFIFISLSLSLKHTHTYAHLQTRTQTHTNYSIPLRLKPSKGHKRFFSRRQTAE